MAAPPKPRSSDAVQSASATRTAAALQLRSKAAQFDYAFVFDEELTQIANEWCSIAQQLPSEAWQALTKGGHSNTIDKERGFYRLDPASDEQQQLQQANAKLHAVIQSQRQRTDAALRARLASLVAAVDEKKLHTAVIKLLYTLPGADAQPVHFDVTKDADQRWAVLLYCNGPTQSTWVPSRPAQEMRHLWWQGDEATPQEEAFAKKVQQNQQEYFTSRTVNAGDALFFRTNVAHYGPQRDAEADKLADAERIVLYALFSPNTNSDQDDHQLFPLPLDK